MRSFLFGVGLIVLASVPAQAAKVRWQGEFLVTKASAGCTDYNPVGTDALVRFRPPIAGSDNGAGSRLSIFQRRYTISHKLVTGSFNSTFKPVETMTISDGFEGIGNPVAVRITAMSPKPTATTDFIKAEGQIKGYDNMPNCVVTFQMSLVRRRD